MTENLKPCPFCGGEAKIVEDVWSDNEFCYVTCVDCNASTNACDTQDEAITKWNNRPTPWHTGTPTEEGYYLCKIEYVKGKNHFCVKYFNPEGTWYLQEWANCEKNKGHIKWQKINEGREE